jgi:Leucine-rich repeat (LRR) protein
MKSLEHIFIDDTDKMDEIVGKLTKLSTIRRLAFGKGLTDDGLIQLKNMQSLQELEIETAKVTSKGIAALSQLSLLRALKLTNMKLPSNEQWNALGKLTSLKRLTLRSLRSNVTDSHLAHLNGLQSLIDLYIDAVVIKDRNAMYSMDITDKSLEHISKLQSLERLTLHGAKITDEGLKYLEKLKSLKEMDLQGCKVTEEGLQRLKKKLPALSWYL